MVVIQIYRKDGGIQTEPKLKRNDMFDQHDFERSSIDIYGMNSPRWISRGSHGVCKPCLNVGDINQLYNLSQLDLQFGIIGWLVVSPIQKRSYPHTLRTLWTQPCGDVKQTGGRILSYTANKRDISLRKDCANMRCDDQHHSLGYLKWLLWILDFCGGMTRRSVTGASERPCPSPLSSKSPSSLRI